jgi:hypothetical protein
MSGRLLLDDLDAARTREFAGRRDDLALFDSLLDSGGAAAVYVCGPGGIGKSTLLHQFAALAARRGRRVVRFDAAETAPTADAVLAGLARAAGPVGPAARPVTGLVGSPVDVDEVLAALAGTPGPVLLIDGAEHLATLDRWMREEVLARLPADSIVVLAGRGEPGLGWRTDAGWRTLLRVIRLRELDPDESREVLRRRGLPEPSLAAALAFARGHPLALVLAAEIGASLAGRPGPTGAPVEAVRELLAVLLDSVPGPRHRAALEASSQVRVTTEPLLAAVLNEPDVHDVFEWLRGMSIVEYAGAGVRPHELLRDLLSTELRWRDPERHAAIHRRAGEYYHRRLGAADSVLFDLAYLHRDSPILGPYLSFVTPGAAAPGDLVATPLRDGEWPLLHDLVVRHEGPGSAELADRWAAPATVSVVRDHDRAVVGFFLLLALEALDPAARDADPATAAAWRHLRDTAPLGPGETALYVRHWLAADTYQEVSAAQTLMTLHLVRLYLTVPGLAATFLPVADADYWTEACAYADLTRAPAADFTVDGRAFAVFAHDWRAVPPDRWLRMLAERETGTEPSSPPAPVEAGLPEHRFAAEVRAALRELGRPDRLAGNGLAATAVVAGDADAPTGPDLGRAVERVLREAAAVLERSPRDRLAYRALHHTYLQPAGTQQRAAELLDLPMSTYRRHLARGVDRLTTLLWHRELAARQRTS